MVGKLVKEFFCFMNVKTYKRFADLAVKVGVNLQKGQDVVIYISTSQEELAKYLVLACYKNGARKVSIEWKNDAIQRLHYRHQGIKPLCKLEPWEIEKEKNRAKTVPCLIHVLDSDPDAFASLNVDKINRAITSRRKAIKPYRDMVDYINQWTIISVPSKAWAQKVYPNASLPDAQKKLWKAIIKCTRLDGKDPIKDWQDHIAYLKEKADKMNALDLKYLHYTSNNGTDLTLYLNPRHTWLSAREKNLKGIEFSANMPTEEVFTMPDKDRVDGIVYATKPLSYQGMLIEDFYIRFKKGRVVEAKARVGQEVLDRIINTDEGSHHLGEVALVPFDSPINECGVLFYETLFDENACCHLALGHAFKNNFKRYENMTEEDFKANGYNDSIEHVDFMIGSEDLHIDGFDSKGNKTVIFDKGVWAI